MARGRSYTADEVAMDITIVVITLRVMKSAMMTNHHAERDDYYLRNLLP